MKAATAFELSQGFVQFLLGGYYGAMLVDGFTLARLRVIDEPA